MISIFKDAFDTTPIDHISVSDFLQAIKYGKWQEQVEKIRNEPDDKKRKIAKTGLVSVTCSGKFTTRAEANLEAHSGFICVDIDGFSDKTALLADKYTYALFRSVSGGGLACFVKVNPQKHKDSFRWLQKYYFESYGIIVDPKPQNTASLRFVSYDPDLFINEKSRQSLTLIEKTVRAHSLPVIISDDKLSELIATAVNRGVDLAPDYKAYTELAFALTSGFGENGRQWFHALCSVNAKYNSRHADKQYDISLKRSNRSGITVGTLYWMLKQNGIEIPSETKKAVTAAAIGKRAGKSAEEIKATLIAENVPEQQAEAITNEVLSRNDLSLQNQGRSPETLIESLVEWMNQNHHLRKNNITRSYEDNGTEITKERLNSIFLRARIAFDTTDVTFDLCERVIISDLTKEYNPITEYIEKNRHRNTSGNIEALLNTIKSETPHAKLFMLRWLVAIIAAYKGHPVRYVLALTGGQFSGKTEWFRRLLPSALQKYYAESKLDRGKDDELLMCQKLIVMDDEMGGKSKQDEKLFKELTSKNVFSLRVPYGRTNEDFKRLAILCGTANDNQIINDRTGNTRILAIEVESIDHELYNRIDKDELFMELVRTYEAGAEWQLSKDELHDLAIISRQFEDINMERELISQFFRRPEDGGGLVSEMTATEIKDYIESHCKQQIRGYKYLGIELKRLFGHYKQRKVDGKKLYSVVKVLENPINEI
jgi:hypothetical protein